MSDEINMHKSLAMGKPTTTEAAGKGVIQKYKKGGSIAESKAANLPVRGSAPPPLARPAKGEAGKIASMKRGGAMPKRNAIDIVIAMPMKKAGRGR
jgi:hypothetical protein